LFFFLLDHATGFFGSAQNVPTGASVCSSRSARILVCASRASKLAERVTISCYLALISARPLVLVQKQCHCALGFCLLHVSGCSLVLGDFVAGPVPFLFAFLPTLLLVRDSSSALGQGACFLGFGSQRQEHPAI
jgi:hypothetical protein